MADGFSEEPRSFRDAPRRGRKRAANVTIDGDILAAAKELGINLSQTLEDELRRKLSQARAARWSEDNKTAIDSYNRFVEEHGIWSEEYRKW
jgi:antitoxin CcdA